MAEPKPPRYVWRTTGTDPCPRCTWLDGREDGDGWSSQREPGDGGPPPLHPNCHCYVADLNDEIREFVEAIR